ncbi:MAG: hypothetical protein ABIN97_09335 [Ginsengibacter sp.]
MRTLITLYILFVSVFANAQSPSIQWQTSLGGNFDDRSRSVWQTIDGGYIVAGLSNSNNGQVNGNHGLYDFWIVKLDNTGSIQWQKSFGGSGDDVATSIQQTIDGGYIIAGSSNSNDGDVTGHHGLLNVSDYWIVKLSSTGIIEWQKSLGGSSEEEATSIQQTTDGGYILAGFSSSNDGDVTGNHGGGDSWIIKLNSTGIVEWQKCLGGSNEEKAYSIEQASDGAYIVAGFTGSNDGDVTGNHGNWDFWLVKLSGIGGIEWQKCLGGSNEEIANSVHETTDGGYVIAGISYSNDGDVTVNHGDRDYWIVKLSSTLNIEWQKSLGGSNTESVFSIQQTFDGSFIVAGDSYSNDGDVSGNHGNNDYWIVKLSSAGNMEWQKSMGGRFDEQASSIHQTTDGGYIVTGRSSVNDGDVTNNNGNFDYWVVKLNPFPSSAVTVWMKDTWHDTGLEPDPATASEYMWQSPYIWVRNHEDVNLVHQHEHQNPDFISLNNRIYVKLHNGSNTSVDDTLKLYWAHAATGLSWPQDWHLITAIRVTGFAPHSTKTAGYHWGHLPGSGSFCLLARWVSASDPMTLPETDDIEANVRGNNNIIWRNVNIVDLIAEASFNTSFIFRNTVKERRMASLVIRPDLKDLKNSFSKYGKVSVQLDKKLMKAWKEGGSIGSGFEKDKNGTLTVSENGATLDNIILDPGSSGNVKLSFERLPKTPGGTFMMDVIQFRTKKYPRFLRKPNHGKKTNQHQQVVGGVTYEIHTDKIETKAK